jgi:hypothetical protein
VRSIWLSAPGFAANTGAGMLRALLLILDAQASWEKIARAERGFFFILLTHVLPLLAITLGVEAFALSRLGETRSIAETLKPVPLQLVVQYACAALALNLGVVIIGAKLIETTCRSFHFRISYQQCFATVAYGLSPLFLARLLDALPGINTWVCFGIGMVAAVGTLYHAVPQVIRPDPAKAMSVYLIMSVLLLGLAGLAHFLALQVLHDELNPRFWQQFIR